MDDNKNQQQRNEGVGEQNLTLNNPGTKVADYGNTPAGTATENNNQSQQQDSNPQRGTVSGSQDNSETIGNP
jgi:hypothetical protein